MNADQLAEIRPALREALAGAEGCCLTLEVSGDADRWIHFVGNTLNCAYRHGQPPTVDAVPPDLVAALGGIRVLNWEAHSFVTYDIVAPAVDPLARLIDAIFTGQLGCAPGAYHLDASFEQL